MNLGRSAIDTLRDALALSEERAAGKPNRNYRMAASFEDWRRSHPELIAAGLMSEDGGITDAGRAALEAAS